MVGRPCTLHALALLMAGLAIGFAHAGTADAAGPSGQAGIFVEVVAQGLMGGVTGLPELDDLTTVPGYPLTVRGVTPPGLYGKPLQITVTPPQKAEPPDPAEAPAEIPDNDCPVNVLFLGASEILPPTVIDVVADVDGSFEAEFTPETFGKHEVEVRDPEGGPAGEASFEVADLSDLVEQPDCAKKDDTDRHGIEAEAEKLTETTEAIIDAVAGKLDELPASPAKDEAKTKLAELQTAMKALRAQGASPEWVNGMGHLVTLQSVASEMRVATMGLSARLKGWHAVAKRANARASTVLAEVTRGNLLCDQLDVAINGLKAVDFFLGLLIQPGAYFVDWAKENVPTKLVSMIPAVKRTKSGTEAVETSWKGITTFAPMREDVAKGHFNTEFTVGLNKMAYALSAFMVSRMFERYCQTFQGPVTGKMTAEFRQYGNLYWTYTVEIKGEIILRYPKGAKGDAIALTGEIMGNAMSFRSWDNAIPVLFPELAHGTVLKMVRQDPMGLGDIKVLNETRLKDKKVLGQDIPNFNPLTTIIDQGGVMVRAGFTPNFFRVPVRGDLRGDTLRLEVQPAAVDFDDARTKVLVLMLPVLSMRITLQDYALPFKGAQFLMLRAMNDGPAEFTVQRSGTTMTIDRRFDRRKPGDDATGVYGLSIKACNPSC
ncbi:MULTISPECIES: hypothetical protein [unclassified Inquilinus]|uniref:hypothetical protein n=1 Tax=unclassified Inquilinus TaxID=2645927 RepID=UPI003F9019E3